MAADTGSRIADRIRGSLGVLFGRYDWYDLTEDPPWAETIYVEPDWANPPPGYMDDELRKAYDEGYTDGVHRR